MWQSCGTHNGLLLRYLRQLVGANFLKSRTSDGSGLP